MQYRRTEQGKLPHFFIGDPGNTPGRRDDPRICLQQSVNVGSVFIDRRVKRGSHQRPGNVGPAPGKGFHGPAGKDPVESRNDAALFKKQRFPQSVFGAFFVKRAVFPKEDQRRGVEKGATGQKGEKTGREKFAPGNKVVPACGGACKGGKKGKLLCEKVSRAEGFRQTAKTLLYLSYRLRVSFPAGDEKICDFFCFPFFPAGRGRAEGLSRAETTAKRRSGLSRRNRAERRIASAVAMELPPNFTDPQRGKSGLCGDNLGKWVILFYHHDSCFHGKKFRSVPDGRGINGRAFADAYPPKGAHIYGRGKSEGGGKPW